ncbi:Yip1 family protein [Streptomyces sp. RFCAC02]|uniref:Yip1 family protein n=1 Tax=Streptomyces sp. RFCAC02 TaxID=2499143 RepID=UPI00102104C3|nr:Yip1 family protein [Streptomyces sp. RFCAC02]
MAGYPGRPDDPYAHGHNAHGQPYPEPDYGYGEPEPAPQPPPQPPLPWAQLLTGIILRPNQTFLRMRDYRMWVPALSVTFIYGLATAFGIDDVRDSINDTTFSALVPPLLATGVAMMLGALLLSTVTHNMARQFGGNGIWAPTAGLAMLIMCLADIPRLALALFMGSSAALVQTVGWATWIGTCVLFTLMVSVSHEISRPRALGSSAIQLLGLLVLVKLGILMTG